MIGQKNGVKFLFILLSHCFNCLRSHPSEVKFRFYVKIYKCFTASCSLRTALPDSVSLWLYSGQAFLAFIRLGGGGGGGLQGPLMISGTIQAGPMKLCTELAGDPKKYSCLIKRKMHKKIVNNKICLDYQWANLDFDILFLIFGCHLADIWMFDVK